MARDDLVCPDNDGRSRMTAALQVRYLRSDKSGSVTFAECRTMESRFPMIAPKAPIVPQPVNAQHIRVARINVGPAQARVTSERRCLPSRTPAPQRIDGEPH
jgi:hypothetical protein